MDLSLMTETTARGERGAESPKTYGRQLALVAFVQFLLAGSFVASLYGNIQLGLDGKLVGCGFAGAAVLSSLVINGWWAAKVTMPIYRNWRAQNAEADEVLMKEMAKQEGAL
jgi:hypothetical protein